MLRLLRVLHKCQIYRVSVQKCMICAMETPYVLRRFTVNAIHSKTYFPTTEFSYAYIMHNTEGRKPGKPPCDWCWYGRGNIGRCRIKCIHKYVIDIDNYCCTKINNTATFPGDSIYIIHWHVFRLQQVQVLLPVAYVKGMQTPLTEFYEVANITQKGCHISLPTSFTAGWCSIPTATVRRKFMDWNSNRWDSVWTKWMT